MVAVAIASIILIMAYASYRSIFNSIKRSTGLSEFYENVNLALLSIDRDISNAYFTRTNKNITFICETDGNDSRLNFVTVNHNDYNFIGTANTPVRSSDVQAKSDIFSGRTGTPRACPISSSAKSSTTGRKTRWKAARKTFSSPTSSA